MIAVGPEEFRKLALSFPEAVEGAHVGHPDFRARGRIFATLGYPDDGWGMVRLSPKDQMQFVEGESKAFVPVKGAWGRQGATIVRLSAVNRATLQHALTAAWTNRAPKRLVQQFGSMAD